MDVLLVNRFGVIGVFLGGESDQTLLKHIYFKRVVTSDQTVDSQVKFKPVDQVGTRQVLGDNVAWFPLDLLFLTDYFYAFTTT